MYIGSHSSLFDSGQLRQLWLILGWLLCPAGVATAQSPSIATFRQDTLLGRFDVDRDGALSDSEKAALRDAFGGIDVPMLPRQPNIYTEVHFPPHIDPAELDQADNTPEKNAITNEGAALGRVLFCDKQLSRNNTIACAS